MNRTDIKAAHVTATGTIFAGPTRFRAFATRGGAADGTLVLRDGGGSGTIICTITVEVDADIFLTLPEAGIKCGTDLHATLTNVAAATIFHG